MKTPASFVLCLFIVLLPARGGKGLAAPDLAALRAEGQPAVDRLRIVLPEGQPVAAASLDRVAAQKDAYTSGLFWHTDFDAALAEAKRLNRPVLSLRLLGRLDEELSCANSRLFRVLLYADPAISQQLRAGYVLHWESVRPVPVMTIDFGDGRRLTRTVTGNSIHYILAPDGMPLDALPGLWSPAEFLRALKAAEKTARDYARVVPPVRTTWLRDHHRRELRRIGTEFRRVTVAAGVRGAARELVPERSSPIPGAMDAGRLAVTKLVIERPLLNAAGVGRPWEAAQAPGGETLRALAEAGIGEVNFAPEVLRFLAEKEGVSGAETDFQNRVRMLRETVSADTVVNGFQLRPRILEWLAENPSGGGILALNERIYRDLFLTPASDLWLGLAADGRFSALREERP